MSRFKKEQKEFFGSLAIKEDIKLSEITKFDNFFTEDYSNDYTKQFICSLLHFMSSDSLVLDCACGDGRFIQLMLSIKKDLTICGIDLSLESIRKAKNKIGRSTHNAYFVVADVDFMPFRSNIFSGITVINLFHHVQYPQISLQEISKSLANNGYMLILEITSNNPLQNFSRKLFQFMPEYIKNSMVEDLVVNGKVPIVTLFKEDTLRNYILSSGLKIIRTGNYGLFLFVLRYISKVFPQIKQIIPYETLTHLHRVERKFLSRNLFKKLCVSAAYIVRRRQK